MQITQLLEEIQRLQLSLTKLQESSVSQISRLEEQLEQKKQHIARLEAKLDLQRDYEDLKRELRFVLIWITFLLISIGSFEVSRQIIMRMFRLYFLRECL